MAPQQTAFENTSVEGLQDQGAVVFTAKMLDYNEGTANFAFVEPEREYGPAPFGRHIACTIC